MNELVREEEKRHLRFYLLQGHWTQDSGKQAFLFSKGRDLSVKHQAWLSVSNRDTYLISHYCWWMGETGTGKDFQKSRKQRPRGVSWCVCRKHKQLHVAGAWCMWGSGHVKGFRFNPGSYWVILSMRTRSNLHWER